MNNNKPTDLLSLQSDQCTKVQVCPRNGASTKTYSFYCSSSKSMYFTEFIYDILSSSVTFFFHSFIDWLRIFVSFVDVWHGSMNAVPFLFRSCRHCSVDVVTLSRNRGISFMQPRGASRIKGIYIVCICCANKQLYQFLCGTFQKKKMKNKSLCKSGLSGKAPFFKRKSPRTTAFRWRRYSSCII